MALPAAERRRAVLEWLLGRAAAVLRIDAARLSPDRPLTELGLDSLAAVELRNAAEETFGVAPTLAELLDGASLTQIAFGMADGAPGVGLGQGDGSGADRLDGRGAPWSMSRGSRKGRCPSASAPCSTWRAWRRRAPST